jgi:hypothetical protein
LPSIEITMKLERLEVAVGCVLVEFEHNLGGRVTFLLALLEMTLTVIIIIGLAGVGIIIQ